LIVFGFKVDCTGNGGGSGKIGGNGVGNGGRGAGRRGDTIPFGAEVNNDMAGNGGRGNCNGGRGDEAPIFSGGPVPINPVGGGTPICHGFGEIVPIAPLGTSDQGLIAIGADGGGCLGGGGT
jgi:hypothetical protein